MSDINSVATQIAKNTEDNKQILKDMHAQVESDISALNKVLPFESRIAYEQFPNEWHARYNLKSRETALRQMLQNWQD